MYEGSDAKALTHHLLQGDQCPGSLQATATLQDNPSHLFFFHYYCYKNIVISESQALATLIQQT